MLDRFAARSLETSRRSSRFLVSAGTLLALTLAASSAHAQEGPWLRRLELRASDPKERGEHALGPAVAALLARGPLYFSDADRNAKAAANRAHDAVVKSGRLPIPRPEDLAAAGAAGPTPLAPIVVGKFNRPGLVDPTGTPPDTTGAIGPTRFIQLVNTRAGIYDRTTGALIASGTLNDLAGIEADVFTVDPQIIWDPTTNRFYYTILSFYGEDDSRLQVGFSTTASPRDLTNDWCHYFLGYGNAVPDYPKLGDSRFFFIIGVNVFASVLGQPRYAGSDLLAISKPPTGRACPDAGTFKVDAAFDIREPGGSSERIFTPVPANQIDSYPVGYVVARNGALPSTTLWLVSVTRDSKGFPVFGEARRASVANYAIPADATQPVYTQKLDSLDARPTQAVQAVNSASGKFSLWTQHTIASGVFSAVRYYEIDPVPAIPVVLKQGDIKSANSFVFNAAISPDRRVAGTTRKYGNSFVIEYNVSGKATNIAPRIVAASSSAGAALQFLVVKNGVGPYRSFECVAAGSTCRWGDYSGATPDPTPIVAGRGVVWGTNQFSGVVNPPADAVNWRTQIFALRP